MLEIPYSQIELVIHELSRVANTLSGIEKLSKSHSQQQELRRVENSIVEIRQLLLSNLNEKEK